MITLSLCMIVRDEEAVLARCLESARDVADEMVVVDTGSQDRTREIARQFTSRLYEFPWQDDFSAARNYSLSLARMDYCFWLDADDVIPEKSQAALRELKQSLPPEIDLVMLKYDTGFGPDGLPACSFYRERIWKNRAGYRFVGRVHEAVPLAGRILRKDISIEHRKEASGYSRRNLDIYQAMQAQGEPFGPRDQFYYARELYYHQYYAQAAQEFLRFLDRPDGWRENQIEACRILSDCYKALGQEEEEAEALLKSLAYGLPRGEICCQLGQYFLDRRRYGQAAWWYRQALLAEPPLEEGGFVNPACYLEIPAQGLRQCREALGGQGAGDWHRSPFSSIE